MGAFLDATIWDLSARAGFDDCFNAHSEFVYRDAVDWFHFSDKLNGPSTAVWIEFIDLWPNSEILGCRERCAARLLYQRLLGDVGRSDSTP
jgi:hypothetical protein